MSRTRELQWQGNCCARLYVKTESAANAAAAVAAIQAASTGSGAEPDVLTGAPGPGDGTPGERVVGVTLANAPTAAPLQNAGGTGDDGHAVSVTLVRMHLRVAEAESTHESNEHLQQKDTADTTFTRTRTERNNYLRST